jgi:hypothetical protein
VLALAAGAVAVVAAGVTTLATVWGLAGWLALAAGLARGRRTGVALGGVGLGSAVIPAGVGGIGPAGALVAAVAAVVAYDLGEEAVSLGRYPTDAPTARAELFHAGGVLALAGLAAGGGYLVFGLSAGRGSAAAAAALLIGAASFSVAIRTNTDERTGR